jgi:isopentenyldiphosphate isomerase
LNASAAKPTDQPDGAHFKLSASSMKVSLLTLQRTLSAILLREEDILLLTRRAKKVLLIEELREE